MDDTIYRQAAIDAVRKCSVKEVTPAYMLINKAEVMTELMMLPSAELEQEHTMEEFMYGQELGNPEDGSL